MICFVCVGGAKERKGGTSRIAAIGGVAESMDMKGMEAGTQSGDSSLDEGTCSINL